MFRRLLLSLQNAFRLMENIFQKIKEQKIQTKRKKHLWKFSNNEMVINSSQISVVFYSFLFGVLIGFLYGINSERKIEQEIQVNMAYRWFLKLDIFDKVPDHSTISQNRRRRFQRKEIFRKLFQQLVLQCIEQGLVDGKLIFTDSTHIKANTSRKSEYIQTIEILSNEYL